MSCHVPRMSFLCIVFTLALFLANTLAIHMLQLSNSTSKLTSISNTLSIRYTCEDPAPRWKSRPLSSDCLRALQLFPLTPPAPDPKQWGLFHHSGANDDFKLPVIQIVGTCIVMVELLSDLEEECSWEMIFRAGNGILNTCARSFMGITKTFGTVQVGIGNGIRVTLSKAHKPFGSSISAVTDETLGTSMVEIS